MQKARPGLIRFKNQALLFLIIAMILLVTGSLIFNSTEAYYYHRVALEAQRFAKSYANNFETAIEASGIVNRLLTEKLLAAGEVTAAAENIWSNDTLAQIAKALHVDEIFAYNPQKIIEYSSSGRYIGWTAAEGHPVDRFIKSGEVSMLEDVRQDTETGIYYKYGYFRGTGGRFVQIGVLADTVNAFLDSFDTRRLLKQVEEDPNIQSACFLGTSHDTAVCGTALEAEPLTPAAQAAAAAGKEWIEALGGGQAYRISLPVYVGGQNAGTLVLHYDLTDTSLLIRNISIIGTSALIFMYLLMLGISLANHKKNKRLTHYAYHDPLTNLPNRRRLEAALRADASGGHNARRAVLLVNYRNFKQINLLFGYQYGEKVIRDLAARLYMLCSEKYRLFHLAADRFVFYVTGYQGREELSALCMGIIAALREALPSKTIGGNIGVVESAYFTGDLETLLKYAMLAGEHVSAGELFGTGFYTSEMEARLQREGDIEKELLVAAGEQADGGLYLMYQPILHLGTNRIKGMEALARLKSGKLGEVSPAEFIPIAEKSQLIVPLGRKILRAACRFLETLAQAGHDDIIISVNISAIQVMRDDFVPDVLAILEQTGVNPCCLGIELTESAFADRIDEINKKLAVLKARGICIAIDDFGTGYSSLAREGDMDISCLKIDRSFIAKITDRNQEMAIAGDIISMAHRLGHEVVAEGVDNVTQKEYLMRGGCDYMQGFLFSKPLVMEDALALLKAPPQVM